MNEETQKPDESTIMPDDKVGTAKANPKTATRKRQAKPPQNRKTNQKKGIGFLTAFVMMFLAAVGGAVLSQLYTHYSPNQEPSVSRSDVKALEARIEALPEPQNLDLAPILARIEALEARPVPSQNIPYSDGEGGELDGSDNRITEVSAGFEARLAALEANPMPDLETFEARLKALEAVGLPQGASENTVSEDLMARIEVLENASQNSSLDERISTLETAVEMPLEVSPELLERLQALETSVQAIPAPVDLSAVEARIASLEVEAQALKSSQEDVIKATAPIPPFPSDAVLKALENTDVASDKGWFGKTFDKYVLADNAEAIKTVSRVELLLHQGRVDMALEQVQSLPEPAQVAAKDWIDAVNARRR